jgi:putative PIN family toxin of toxin-antitoxin system
MRRKSKLLRAVVDTNLFVSGLIIKRGLPYQLVEAFRTGVFTLLVSPTLTREYERVLSEERFLQRYGLTQAEVADFLFLVDTTAFMVTPRQRLPVPVRDPKDEKILAAALGGQADCLVTGDDDLLALRDHPKLKTLKIVTVREFLERLPQQRDRS